MHTHTNQKKAGVYSFQAKMTSDQEWDILKCFYKFVFSRDIAILMCIPYSWSFETHTGKKW